METDHSFDTFLSEKDFDFMNIDPRKAIIVVFIVALPLISINIQRDPGEAPWFLVPVTWVQSAMHYSYKSFSTTVTDTTQTYLNLWGINKEIRRLRKENDFLQAGLRLQNELKSENDRLRKLIGFKKNSPMELLPANVIGRDLVNDRDTVIIDRGLNHGLKAGQAVISTEGAIGYIFRPTLLTSQILLITDRYTVIDSTVQRSRARGIIEGTNEGFCRLRYLERADDVQVGDLVVTSGLDNIFPKGFPVGRVTKVEKSRYGISQEVDVQPVTNSNRLEEVFVILDAANADLSTSKVSQQ